MGKVCLGGTHKTLMIFLEENSRKLLVLGASLELFQAVLGGTDSILNYLETNVEP